LTLASRYCGQPGREERKVPNRIKELDGLSVGPSSGGPVENIRPGTAVSSSTAGSNSALGSSDSVQITPYARLLTSLAQAVQNTPEIDAARVNRLQQAIGAGQFRIDPEQTATRLLRLEQDLGDTGAK
jgi:negative regulator of flagellin synthesis FlgM